MALDPRSGSDMWAATCDFCAKLKCCTHSGKGRRPKGSPTFHQISFSVCVCSLMPALHLCPEITSITATCLQLSWPKNVRITSQPTSPCGWLTIAMCETPMCVMWCVFVVWPGGWHHEHLRTFDLKCIGHHVWPWVCIWVHFGQQLFYVEVTLESLAPVLANSVAQAKQYSRAARSGSFH